MFSRLVLLLALTIVVTGCAHETAFRNGTDQYSGSLLDRRSALKRSQFIFVGKILESERSRVPGNSFFILIKNKVKVVQSIRGQTSDEVRATYSLSGTGFEAPFRAGDLCIFCIFSRSSAEPPEYKVGKILPATLENIALVRSEAGH